MTSEELRTYSDNRKHFRDYNWAKKINRVGIPFHELGVEGTRATPALTALCFASPTHPQLRPLFSVIFFLSYL